MSYSAKGQLFFAMTPTADAVNWDYNWHWYNGAGLRVVTHMQGGTAYVPGLTWNPAGNRTYYVYDGSDVSMTLVRASGNWRIHQRFLTGGVDQPLAGWFSNNSGSSSQALVLVTDEQGSVRAAVKADGTREGNAAYFNRSPFGSMEGASGTGAGSTATNTETGYTGASSPNSTGGFTYLRNRWYDPQTGRFLTQDPIGLAGGVNLYSYAGGNPVAFSDPFGLCIPWPACAVAAAEGGAEIGAAIGTVEPGGGNTLGGVIGGVVGFVGATITAGVIVHELSDRQKAIQGVAGQLGVVADHLSRFANLDPNDPEGPNKKRDWVKDMRRAINNAYKAARRVGRRTAEDLRRQIGEAAEKVEKAAQDLQQ